MCKEKEITVLKVSPHKKPEVVTLKNELSALQEAVNSGVKDYHHLIQLVGVEEGVDLLLNDEGKLIGFEPNRRFGQDVLVGDFYVVGTDGENLASLPQDKMEKYAALFAEPEDISEEKVSQSICRQKRKLKEQAAWVYYLCSLFLYHSVSRTVNVKRSHTLPLKFVV